MKLYQALIAGLIACSFAVADSTSTTACTKAKSCKTAPACKAKCGTCKTVKGSIVSIDATANTIIVKVKKAEDTFSTTDSTVVMPKGKTLADLKADDKVSVSYSMKDGKMVACKIELKKASKAKKPPSAPAAPTMGSNSVK